MDSLFEDLKWKAEYLQKRGYYTNMTLMDLIEMLRAAGEKPYVWKHDTSKKIVSSTENIDEPKDS